MFLHNIYKKILLHPGPLTLFDIWAFLNHQSLAGGGGHHNFVVIAPMIMKLGTGIKLDVFYTMVTKVCDVTTIT